jgi:hypothetical protein
VIDIDHEQAVLTPDKWPVDLGRTDVTPEPHRRILTDHAVRLLGLGG